MSKSAVPIVRKLMSSTKHGVVVSAGLMDRAVKVRVAGQEWNKKFRKHFPAPINYLVADPNNSLVEGDVVRIASGHRYSKMIRHVVTAIVAPFGAPVEERPPVLSEDELLDVRIRQRLLKDVRSAQRGRQASISRVARARKMGIEIPSLEEAMRNVTVGVGGSTDSKAQNTSKVGAHSGQAGQTATRTQRQTAKGTDRPRERAAKQDVKRAQTQAL